jgi:hypothetical protein
MVVEIGE